MGRARTSRAVFFFQASNLPTFFSPSLRAFSLEGAYLPVACLKILKIPKKLCVCSASTYCKLIAEICLQILGAFALFCRHHKFGNIASGEILSAANKRWRVAEHGPQCRQRPLCLDLGTVNPDISGSGVALRSHSRSLHECDELSCNFPIRMSN